MWLRGGRGALWGSPKSMGLARERGQQGKLLIMVGRHADRAAFAFRVGGRG